MAIETREIMAEMLAEMVVVERQERGCLGKQAEAFIYSS